MLLLAPVSNSRTIEAMSVLCDYVRTCVNVQDKSVVYEQQRLTLRFLHNLGVTSRGELFGLIRLSGFSKSQTFQSGKRKKISEF